MNTQNHCSIQKNTFSKDEGELTLVHAANKSGAHVPVNHLDYDVTRSNHWNYYYH